MCMNVCVCVKRVRIYQLQITSFLLNNIRHDFFYFFVFNVVVAATTVVANVNVAGLVVQVLQTLYHFSK